MGDMGHKVSTWLKRIDWNKHTRTTMIACTLFAAYFNSRFIMGGVGWEGAAVTLAHLSIEIAILIWAVRQTDIAMMRWLASFYGFWVTAFLFTYLFSAISPNFFMANGLAILTLVRTLAALGVGFLFPQSASVYIDFIWPTAALFVLLILLSMHSRSVKAHPPASEDTKL